MTEPESETAAVVQEQPAVRQQLTGWRLYLLGLALGLANLMMALDVSIMGTGPLNPPARHTSPEGELTTP